MSPQLLELIRINSAIAGLIITAGAYAQAVKIFQTKSARDFSLLLILALLYNELSWLLYGFSIDEWPISVLALAVLPAEIAVLYGYLRYGRGAAL
jgi:MtN3 and saliva related transmembrane protein